MDNKKLLGLLDDIEVELKKINEWKKERSAELDWWLPLSEYFQFIQIPIDRELLQRGELPNWNTSHLDAIASEWIRNPRWEKVADRILEYYKALYQKSGTDEPMHEYQFQFFKLLSEEQAKHGTQMAEQVMKFAKDLFSQMPEHQETLNHIISMMEVDIKMLARGEVPEVFEERTANYFSTVEYDFRIDPIEKAVLNYQSWLMANLDNKRIPSSYSRDRKAVTIEVPSKIVNEMFETVYTEVGRITKIEGYRIGNAPIDALKKHKAIRHRALDMIRERLMHMMFEETVLKPDPNLMTCSFQEVLAEFQPTSRLVENETFKFSVVYRSHFIKPNESVS